MKFFKFLFIFFIFFIKLNTSTPILFERYSWSSVNSINSLVLSGKGFDYGSNNIAIINNVENSCGVAIASPTLQGYDQITCASSATSSIVVASEMVVSVKSNGVISNVQSWYLIQPISIRVRSVVTLGDPQYFTGSFSTNDRSIINVTIGGKPCTIGDTSPSSIIVYIPYQPVAGVYDFIMDISGLRYITSITYVLSAPPTLTDKYSWTTLPNGKTVLTFYGYRLTSYADNIVIINGVEYNATAGIVTDNGLQKVTLYDDQVTNSIGIGDMFIVSAKVSGQLSLETHYFYLIRFMSINETTPLYDIGGDTIFNGSFVQGISASFYIDSSYTQVTSVYSTYIAFTYSPKQSGTYPFKLNMGGYELVGYIAYIDTPAPIVIRYVPNNSQSLELYGQWFGIYFSNDITINNGTVITDATPKAFKGYDTLTFNPGQTFSIGDVFSLQVQVNGRPSKLVNFVYINSISIITQPLNTTGGIVTFSGSFTVSDVSFVTALLINNSQQCNVLSVTPTQITFRYPRMVSGQYSLLINIGGFENSTNIVEYTIPTSPTILNTYRWSSDNKMIFTGKSFSYVNQNFLIINGQYTLNATLAVGSKDKVGYDDITFETISPLSSFEENQIYTVQVYTGGLFSNIVTITFIKPISINTQDIYSVDGIEGQFTTINGVFGTSTTNKTIVSSFYIGTIECDIISIDSFSINFSHSLVLEEGENDLLLNIGELEFKSTINVISPPKPILLNSYYWSSNDILVLKGSTFNFKQPNIVFINQVGFDSTVATLKNANDEITFNNDSSTSSLTIGQSFTVYVNNRIEDSNSISFILIKSISITSIPLNNTGGKVIFSGDYHVSNTSLVSLLIDDTTIEITNITPNSISFNYPSKPIGQYNLIINIGGFEYSTTVQYITTPSPSSTTGTQTTGTQTTGTQTTGTQTTGTQTTGTTGKPDLSDDPLSHSSKLSSSFISATITLLLLFSLL
ncbi:hypothetical protein ACTA71_007461 [Dictyostelium dimigraforme]